MIWLSLTPVDAWFFRDGRPYAQGDADQVNVTSTFPPSPLTVSGALRAGFARANGWSGEFGAWGAELDRRLGAGTEETGDLQFIGPFLGLRDRLLFAMPAHVIRSLETPQVDLMAPGQAFSCDLGLVHLPQPRGLADGTRWDSVSRAFVSLESLESILSGTAIRGTPWHDAGELWQLEARVGIARDPETHAVGEGALYSPVMVRLMHDVSLMIGVSGLPDGWQIPQMIALGGEARAARVQQVDEALVGLPAICGLDGDTATVIALTPLRYPIRDGGPCDPRPGAAFFEAFGVHDVEIVSACSDLPIMIGGWSSQARRPLPLRPCARPGTVLFCRLGSNGRDALLAAAQGGLGPEARLGFNRIAVGRWPT